MIQILYKLKIKLNRFFSNLLFSISSILKVLIQSKLNISSFPKSTNKRASILANGPSLNESLSTNLSFIKESELYCVNFFCLSEWFCILKPQNYVLLDQAFFFTEKQLIDRPDILNALERLIQDTNWKINMFIPFLGKNSYFCKRLVENKNVNIVFYNYTIFSGFNFLKYWFYKKRLGNPLCQNVLGITLYLSLTREKHQEIYIFGADHSWHENFSFKNGELLMVQPHFYDNNKDLVEKQIKDPTNLDKQIKVFDIFNSLRKVFESYYTIEQYSKYRKVKVFNASSKSYIDAFPLIKLKND